MVGESGAGKSLTGAAIIGLIDPPAGRILRSGRRINPLPYEKMHRIRGALDRRRLTSASTSIWER